MVNQCVICGAEMPEGDHVCKDCITRSEGKIAWVPVTKRLPDPGERVLATDGYFVGEAYHMQDGSWVRLTGMDWEQALCGTVTHWMPMPMGPLPVRKDEEVEG